MKLTFTKYHALGNSFLVVESREAGRRAAWGKIARTLCDSGIGIGADGLLVVSPSTKADCRADVYNADGSWAERSGNGLRIVGLHLFRREGGRVAQTFSTLMGGERCDVRITGQLKGGRIVTASIGAPEFRSAKVPVKSRLKHVVNQTITIGRERVTATCLSVGNPHCVIPVDNFAFDWKALGRAIELAPQFPQRTNVEFVRVLSRKRIRVAEWERGAGATGSSGTGAAAAVAALVILGRVDRKCDVQFDAGTMSVFWDAQSNRIEVGGPVAYVTSGSLVLG